MVEENPEIIEKKLDPSEILSVGMKIRTHEEFLESHMIYSALAMFHRIGELEKKFDELQKKVDKLP